MKSFEEFLIEKAGALSANQLLAKGATRPATPARLVAKNFAPKQVNPVFKFNSKPETIASPLK